MKKQTQKVAPFRPLDLLVILAVLVCSVLLLFLPSWRGKAGQLAVGTPRATVFYPLEADRVLTLQENGYTLVVVIEGGEVYVQASDCPEQVCRRTGRIFRPGESILCSRAGVLLRIEGEGMYDAVAG